MSRLYHCIGLIFSATGLLHTALGLALFGNQLTAIYAAGPVDGIGRHFDRGFAFWFVMAGLIMIILGYLMDWIVRKQQLRLPKTLGYVLIIVCVIGVIVMPVSGFWLVLGQGVYIAVQAEKTSQTTYRAR